MKLLIVLSLIAAPYLLAAFRPVLGQPAMFGLALVGVPCTIAYLLTLKRSWRMPDWIKTLAAALPVLTMAVLLVYTFWPRSDMYYQPYKDIRTVIPMLLMTAVNIVPILLVILIVDRRGISGIYYGMADILTNRWVIRVAAIATWCAIVAVSFSYIPPHIVGNDKSGVAKTIFGASLLLGSGTFIFYVIKDSLERTNEYGVIVYTSISEFFIINIVGMIIGIPAVFMFFYGFLAMMRGIFG